MGTAVKWSSRCESGDMNLENDTETETQRDSKFRRDKGLNRRV